MLDLNADKQKVNLADNGVLEIVPMRGGGVMITSVSLGSSATTNKQTFLAPDLPYFDLLYSNSMCKQSSMPTSILIELLIFGSTES